MRDTKQIFIYLTIFCLLANIAIANDWTWNSPQEANFSFKAFGRSEHLKLHVPKSFEGRTAEEWRDTIGIEAFNSARFSQTNSRVQLRGSVSVFDFDYKEDILDIQIFKSHKIRPGSNTCMDCHGGKFPRTTAIIGQSHQILTPKPVKRGRITFTLDSSTTEAFHTEINHWLSKNLMAKFDYKWGYIKQGRHHLTAKAYTLGLAGTYKHRLSWSGDLIYSDTKTYKARKTFVGKLFYTLVKGLKIGVSGGAFLDGYTHFGTEMAEMGVATIGLEKDDPGLLPSLFTKLKDDAFGYWHYSIEYEYKF